MLLSRKKLQISRLKASEMRDVSSTDCVLAGVYSLIYWIFIYLTTRDIIVRIESRIWAGLSRNCVSILIRDRCSTLQSVQTGCGPIKSLIHSVMRALSPMMERLPCEVHHSPPISEVKYGWKYVSAPPPHTSITYIWATVSFTFSLIHRRQKMQMKGKRVGFERRLLMPTSL